MFVVLKDSLPYFKSLLLEYEFTYASRNKSVCAGCRLCFRKGISISYNVPETLHEVNRFSLTAGCMLVW